MDELKWIEDFVIPETSEDAIELLKIIDKFSKFPTNMKHARGNRLDLLRGYMEDIISINITNVVVADVACQWLNQLDELRHYGGNYGMIKWEQKGIRRMIRNMKKRGETYNDKILNATNFWYSMTAEEMMEPWVEKMK
jgi:hypothetical protein